MYGLTLCAVAGVSGAGAAVFGKLAGTQDIDTATQVTCYGLLIVVSDARMLQGWHLRSIACMPIPFLLPP